MRRGSSRNSFPAPRATPERARWLAGLSLLLVISAAPGCSGDPASRTKAVVLVVVDTLRADHLGAYGYSRQTSPNLDRLAAEGECYRQAFSQSPWTLPAMATILTGQPPQVHGAGRDAVGRLYPVRPEIPTLAERLQTAGYRTAAFINVVFCEPKSGLARGFELYDFHTSDASNRGHRNAAATTDAALSWIRELRGEPFFLLVHYFDPHLTYDPPAPYDALFEPDAAARIPEGFGSASQVFALRRGEIRLTPGEKTGLIARYDGEIRFVDEQFGRLRRGLEELGLWDQALVIVVADHGEEFWDHGGFEHGHTHYRELLHVPLIVKRPAGTPAVRHERVRQLDILPTVLDFAQLEAPSELPGKVLGGEGAAFSVAVGSLWAGELLSIRSDQGTLILDRSSGARQFFAPDDPAETRSLGDRQLAPASRLEQILVALPRPARDEDAPWEPTEEQRERLRSLGYVR